MKGKNKVICCTQTKIMTKTQKKQAKYDARAPERAARLEKSGRNKTDQTI